MGNGGRIFMDFNLAWNVCLAVYVLAMVVCVVLVFKVWPIDGTAADVIAFQMKSISNKVIQIYISQCLLASLRQGEK